MLLQHVVITLNDGTKGVFTGRAFARATDKPKTITEVEFSEPVEIPLEGAEPLTRIQATANVAAKPVEPAPPEKSTGILFAEAVAESAAAKAAKPAKQAKKKRVKAPATASKHAPPSAGQH